MFLGELWEAVFGGGESSLIGFSKPLGIVGCSGVIGFRCRLRSGAVLLYMAGLSYRDITYVLRVVSCSHEAVRLWVKKLEQVTVNVTAKPRRTAAVDETKIKADGKWRYVWAAIDVDTSELLAIWVSWQRNIMHTEAFLKRILETCTNKPLFLVDKGP